MIRALNAAAAVCAFATAGCQPDTDAESEPALPGVAVERDGMAALRVENARRFAGTPDAWMERAGLVAVQGGARVKVQVDGSHDALLPLPQLVDSQIPLTYALTTDPPDAAESFHLLGRAGGNVAVQVRLSGLVGDEIGIAWSSVVLVAEEPAVANAADPAEHAAESPCVQAKSERIATLAAELWPEDGNVGIYAANIQAHIAAMEQETRPRSLDAVGILESGGNWICTANANLGAALLRSKAVPARTMAVVPPNAQRLEMHRTVEYFADGVWWKFDPSSLHRDIPMKPWQGVVMAKTTAADEEAAMVPRMGVMLGCPYGHELEFLGVGMTFTGKDFFWTSAKPLAEFDAEKRAVGKAKSAWEAFLKTGKLDANSKDAARAGDSAAFSAVWASD